MAKAFQVLTLNKISPTGLKRLPAGRYHVGDKVAHPDAILVRSHNMLEMDIPPSVLAIARAGAAELPLQINSTFTRRNIAEFDLFPPLLEKIKPATWSVFLLVPTGRGKVEDLLTITKLITVFDVKEDEADAMAAFRS